MDPRGLEALVGSFACELIDALTEHSEQPVRPRYLHAFERVAVHRVERELVERAGTAVGIQHGDVDGTGPGLLQVSARPQEPAALAAVLEKPNECGQRELGAPVFGRRRSRWVVGVHSTCRS